ncbi:MAG: DMT family transporter [Rhizobiaceae bacterium]|nr:DMT family transporter [Rhizobiaceae bacterium]
MSPAGRRDAIDAFAVAVMIALTFSWGLNGVAAKIANTGYSPILVALTRSAAGSFLVFLWCRWRGVRLFERDGTLWVGLLAGLLFGLEFQLIFVGLDYTSVARNTLLVNTMPFWTLIAGHFLLGERISARKFAGLILAFAGLVLIFSDRLSAPGPDALFGDILSLAAGVAWAATMILIKGTRLSTIAPEKLLLYQLATAALMAAVTLPFAGPAIRDVGLAATGALAFQALYIVAVTYVVWFSMVQRYPASGLSSFTILTPVFGVLLGGVLLGEALGATIFLALALIVAGLALVNRQPRNATGT